MSFSFIRLVSSTLTSLSKPLLLRIAVTSQPCVAQNSFHSLVSPHEISKTTNRLSGLLETPGNSWSHTSVRTKIRDNFPRPNEKKRLQLSFQQRMKTRGGRAILMRRYLKGRHVLSH